MTEQERKIADEIFKYVGGEPCVDNCDYCDLLRKRLIAKLNSIGIGLNNNGVFLPFSESEDK